MNSEDKRDDTNAIVSETNPALATRSPSLISRGLRDLTGLVDSTIVELGKALTSCLQLDQVLGTIVEKIDELLHPDAWSMLLVDEQKQELYFELAVGKGARALEEVRIKVGQGLAGWVAQTGQAVIVPDVSKDTRFFSEVDGRPELETRSIVAMPVRYRERCLGVIQLINCVGPEGFSKRRLGLLEALADFAAIALENFRHVQRIHELTITDEETGLYNGRHSFWGRRAPKRAPSCRQQFRAGR